MNKLLLQFLHSLRQSFQDLLPIILVLMLFGALIVLTGGSAIAPFIYAIF